MWFVLQCASKQNVFFSFKYLFYFGFWNFLGHFPRLARVMPMNASVTWKSLSQQKTVELSTWLTFGFLQCFRHSDLANGRPTTQQFREKLPWFLNALPSSDCAKGGNGAYTTNVELEGWPIICIVGCFP